MMSTFKNSLSRIDSYQLLDLAYKSLHANNKDDLKGIILQLQVLIPFESAIVWHGGFIKKRTFQLSDSINVGLSDDFLNTYVHEKYYIDDPVAKASLKRFDFIDIDSLFKQYPKKQSHPVFALACDFQMWGKNNFVLALRSFDFTHITAFTFFNILSMPNRRTETVIKYFVPFAGEVFKKCVSKEENLSAGLLSARETEIIKWLKEGKTSWEISMILDIGERTVNFHVTNLMRKLNATKRMQAVAIALKARLIEL